MKYLLLALVGAWIYPSSASADESNCVLRIRTVMTDGKKQVTVKETGAYSRSECKAKAKEIEDSNREIAEIQKTVVTFSFREPKPE